MSFSKLIFLFIVSIILFACKSSCQVKNYNTKIENAKNVNIYIDTQMVYINGKVELNTTKLYLLGINDLTTYLIDSSGKTYSKNDITHLELILGNPDSVPTLNINISIEFSSAFDSIYVDTKTEMTNWPFNPNYIRDSKFIVSKQKTLFTLQASYLAPNKKIKLHIIKKGSNKMTLTGVGKLF